MTYYEIEQTETGHLMGIWDAESPEEAIQAMAEDAGAEVSTGTVLTTTEGIADEIAGRLYLRDRFEDVVDVVATHRVPHARYTPESPAFGALAREVWAQLTGLSWEERGPLSVDPGIVAREVEVAAEIIDRDDDAGVLADVRVCGRGVGSVVLLPSSLSGELSIWGPSQDAWADRSLQAWLALAGACRVTRRGLIDLVVDAVRAADRKE